MDNGNDISSKDKESYKVKIDLLENGRHSLKRGIETFNKYLKNHNKMLLKESILFLNHGIELLMKQILIKHSEYLIFDNLGEARRKQKEANDNNISIFALKEPPRTVTFNEAIYRIEAFINPPELTEELKDNLDKLNKIRNHLEHYEIDIDIDIIKDLISKIHQPLITFFETHIDTIKEHRLEIPNKAWEKIDDYAKRGINLDNRVYKIMNLFNEQKIDGKLFNVDGEITLPKFNPVGWQLVMRFLDIRYDLVTELHGKIDNGEWIVGIKKDAKSVTNILNNILKYYAIGALDNIQTWIIVISNIPNNIREKAKQNNIYLSTLKEFEELELLLKSNEHPG